VTSNLPRGSLKTKPRRRWVLALGKDKAAVFQGRSEASSFAKKYRAKLVDVVECKSKPEKPAAPKAQKKEEASAKKAAAPKSRKAKKAYKKKPEVKKTSKRAGKASSKKLARKYNRPVKAAKA
jgi:hypothetical protein